MSSNYCPIMSTLGYVLSPDGKSVLMTHRIARKSDEQFGKYNGLGGHMLPNENIAQCLIREVREEANIEIKEMHLRGTLNWTGFGPNGESWIAFVFLVTKFEGTPVSSNEEGELSWIPLSQISTLPIYEGDKYFLPLVFDDDPRIFHGYMPYDNETPLDWQVTRI